MCGVCDITDQLVGRIEPEVMKPREQGLEISAGANFRCPLRQGIQFVGDGLDHPLGFLHLLGRSHLGAASGVKFRIGPRVLRDLPDGVRQRRRALVAAVHHPQQLNLVPEWRAGLLDDERSVEVISAPQELYTCQGGCVGREIRGTVASDLRGALREMSAVAAGTRCKRNLYHASINVRIEERLELVQWMFSIDSLEKRLQLLGQPRIVVMHKKHGREHLHIVWSRIDALKMCAIPDSHNYRAHEEVSRELERVFGHQYTQGAHVERDGLARPKRTHSHAEQQQRDRTKGNEIASIVSEITSLWRSTNNGTSFQAALQERSYILARGDRRDFVIVDRRGGIHSLARRIEGVRVAQLRARLQDLDFQSLPSAKEARVEQEARLAAQRPALGDLQSPLATFQNLLRTRSYVTEQDLEQAFEDVVTRKLAINLIREQSGTLRLYEAAGGQFVGYTTRDVCMQESATVAAARRLATTQRSPIAPNHLEALREWGLSEEQAIAARQILSGMQLSVLIGRAGTGKTAALNAIRLLAERDGYEICALGPTNAVVADLKDAGFARASTIHSLLWYQDHAPHHPNAQLARKTLIVLDEAGMVDTARLQRLLALARAG